MEFLSINNISIDEVIESIKNELLENWSFNFHFYKKVILNIFKNHWKWYSTDKNIKQFVEMIWWLCTWTMSEALDIILPYRDWNHTIRILSRVEKMTLSDIEKLFIKPDLTIKWEEWQTKWLPIIQNELVKRVRGVFWEDMEKVLCNDAISISHRETMAKQTSPLFSEIRDFLLDEKVHFSIRVNLFLGARTPSIQELLKFLEENPNIHTDLIQAIKDKVNYLNSIWNTNNNVDEIILIKLRNLKVANSKLRKQNIAKINKKQRTDRNEMTIWYKIWPNDRRLAFYYRGVWQWAYDPHYTPMIKFIKAYIEWWYSEVFSIFSLISRQSWEYPNEFESDYLDVEWTSFQIATNIYTNTIHLNDWTPEFEWGTIPILWSSITKNEHRKWIIWNNDYVDLDLFYCWWENEHVWKKLWLPNIPDLELEDIFDRLLFSIKECERKMLEKIKWTDDIIENIRTNTDTILQ